MSVKAVVCHSGGMDSSICLKVAIDEFGAENVLSMGFSFGQRHSIEIERADALADRWGVKRVVVNIDCLSEITESALLDQTTTIEHKDGEAPNTLVTGRNGLMGRLAAIHADHLGASCIYMGVMGLEAANSGYRDCSPEYIELLQKIMQVDLGNDQFEIRTPLIDLTKCESLELADRLGVLEELLLETITCYEGVPLIGCQKCPACKLRNEGIIQFYNKHPEQTPPPPYLDLM